MPMSNESKRRVGIFTCITLGGERDEKRYSQGVILITTSLVDGIAMIILSSQSD